MQSSLASPVERMDLRDRPGRVFVVGDLHGMAHALDQLLAVAGFDPGQDLLWSLGDLADRGPFSPRCLDLLDEPWFRAIRGNHEQLLLDAVDDHEGWLNWNLNGGDWSQGYPWDREDLCLRLDSLPYAADLRTRAGHIGLVHADVGPGSDWPDFLDSIERDGFLSRELALWSRSSANRAANGLPGRRVSGVDLVLVGHSIVETAFQWGNIWFLDTGAVATSDPTAALSMLEVHPGLRLWSLPTAGDPAAGLWWSQRMERVAEAMARAR